MISRGFARIPDAPACRLANARAPTALLGAGGLAADPEGFAHDDLIVAEGRIASLVPAGTATLDGDLPAFDCDGGLVLPRLVDIHTHLDKGHIWPRKPNPDGTFAGALGATAADREAHWSAEDVRARMDFSLRCAFVHGTGAIRTHLDCVGPQAAISWPVFAAMRDAWAGRIALQGVSLFPVELALDDEAAFQAIVRLTAAHRGILGGVTFTGESPRPRIVEAVGRAVQAAREADLDLDLHVDESGSSHARTLEIVAEAVRSSGFSGRVLCGHCCSLSVMPKDELERVVAGVAQANIAAVSLPMCNMYLQDRAGGRTPRWRGVAPLHELKAAGVPVMVASDNTRDPFHAYGDLDMIEVFREATRILHLDHAGPAWIRAIAATPADVMGLSDHGRLTPGGRADLVLTRARGWSEFLAHPQTDRTVLVAGRPIDTTPPDYRELDGVLQC